MIDTRNVPLTGKRTAALAQALAYIPSDAKLPKVATGYLSELSKQAHNAGLDFAVLAAQSAEETDRWRSDVWASNQNATGMKTGDGSAYIAFKSGEDAARAQVVQMCAYVYGSCPDALKPYLPLAPRFDLAVELYGGSVAMLAHLGNGRWAEDPDYAVNIASHLEAIRLLSPTKPPKTNTAATLQFIDLSDKVSNHFGRPFPPVAMVYHCTDDLNLQNTISWFENPNSQASSNYVVDRDGTIYRMVDPATGSAWTNGDVMNPRTDIPWLNSAIASGDNVNLYTVTIETVATPSVPPTELQYHSLIAIAQYEGQRWGLSPHRGHQLRHRDINSVTRPYCPGPDFDLARIIIALGGDPANMTG